MNKKINFFDLLNWLEYFFLITLAIICVTYNIITVHYQPIIQNSGNKFHYFGFPIINGKYLLWSDHLQKELYIVPTVLDAFFYFMVFSFVYWFIVRYIFNLKLKKKYFIPLIFGMVFTILILFIVPDQEFSVWHEDLNNIKFSKEFYWYDSK